MLRLARNCNVRHLHLLALRARSEEKIASIYSPITMRWAVTIDPFLSLRAHVETRKKLQREALRTCLRFVLVHHDEIL